MDSFLSVDELSVSYGKVCALRSISLKVPRGSIVTMIGANGAGKSSTLRALASAICYQGKIFFDGIPLREEEPSQRASRGISLVPEGRSIFSNLTVAENLRLGAWSIRSLSERQENLDRIFYFFPKLRERYSQIAGTLSGGEQQMLALGRSLVSKPRLLLLDEPSMGLSPLLIKEVFSIIKKINEEGITILLVEQNATMALQIAHYAYFLELGAITLEGLGEELLGHQKISSGYLGK